MNAERHAPPAARSVGAAGAADLCSAAFAAAALSARLRLTEGVASCVSADRERSSLPSVERSEATRLADASCLGDAAARAACFACLACFACTSTECGDFFRVGGRLVRVAAADFSAVFDVFGFASPVSSASAETRSWSSS